MTVKTTLTFTDRVHGVLFKTMGEGGYAAQGPADAAMPERTGDARGCIDVPISGVEIRVRLCRTRDSLDGMVSPFASARFSGPTVAICSSG